MSNTQTSPFVLRRVAAGMLLVYSLYHGMIMVLGSKFTYAGLDPIVASEERFGPLKKQLQTYGPAKVGYVTDTPEVADWFTGFYQMQYALAPIVVADSTDLPLVVANFHDASSSDRVVRDRHLVLVADCGKGVFLFSNQKQ